MDLPPIIIQLVLILELHVHSIGREAQRQDQYQDDDQNHDEQSGVGLAETLWFVVFEATVRYLNS